MLMQQSGYSDGVMLPVLPCLGCGRRLQLPYRRFLNSDVVEPYWSEDGVSMVWVCDTCGRYASSTAHDLLWISADELFAPAASRGFWRVEILCGRPQCIARVVAHVQTFGQTSRKNLGLMIANASPTPVCPLGHLVTAQSSYPERIDFVEWTGPTEYIT